jgi:hypothetical protein
VKLLELSEKKPTGAARRNHLTFSLTMVLALALKAELNG